MISELLPNQVHLLTHLQPHDWGDITITFNAHINHTYFKAFKYKIDNEVIGVGQYIVLEDTAWIGNIIVHQNYRSKGYGKAITIFLIEKLYQLNIKNIYLLATPLGKPVYEKIGFKSDGRYIFYKTENKLSTNAISKYIFKSEENDYENILKLDQIAMDENRSSVLKYFIKQSWVYKKDAEFGFYIPELGNGLIIANSFKAGKSLFELRENSGIKFTCIPENSNKWITYLKQRNYKSYREATFMHLGDSKHLNPNFIYTRIGGNLG